MPLNYREVGLDFIPVDSRHVSELPIKNKKRQVLIRLISPDISQFTILIRAKCYANTGTSTSEFLNLDMKLKVKKEIINLTPVTFY